MQEFFRCFDHWVSARPGHPAITDSGLTLTYAGLNAASNAAAHQLTDNGLGPGAMIGYLGEAGLLRVVSLMAAIRVGVIFVPMDPRDPLPVVAELAGHARIDAVLIDTDTVRPMAEALGVPIIGLPQDWNALGSVPRFEPVAVPDDAVAYVRYTSGSTGRPKGIPLSQGYEWHNTKVTAEAFGCRSDDVATVFSFFWPAQIFGPLSVGASLEYFDFQRRGPAEMV